MISKQKMSFLTMAVVVSFLGSAIISTNAFALSKTQFAEVLCGRFQGPAAGGGTVADVCRRDARDGTLSKSWHDKVIKFEDWKNKTAAQLYRHIGQTPPADPPQDDPDNPDEECDSGCSVLEDPAAGDDCGGVDTAIIKCNQDNSGGVEDNGIWGLLLIAINILTAGVGILAVGGIVYGSILYTTAEDRADQIKKATDIITNVVIGLVSFALMWAGLNFLIPGGIFS